MFEWRIQTKWRFMVSKCVGRLPSSFGTKNWLPCHEEKDLLHDVMFVDGSMGYSCTFCCTLQGHMVEIGVCAWALSSLTQVDSGRTCTRRETTSAHTRGLFSVVHGRTWTRRLLTVTYIILHVWRLWERTPKRRVKRIDTLKNIVNWSMICMDRYGSIDLIHYNL